MSLSEKRFPCTSNFTDVIRKILQDAFLRLSLYYLALPAVATVAKGPTTPWVDSMPRYHIGTDMKQKIVSPEDEVYVSEDCRPRWTH